MPSFRNLLLPITFSLAAITTAATCPQNWLEQTVSQDDSKCCYGNMVMDDNDTYCCVYNLNPALQPSSVSIATTTNTNFEDSWSTADYCFTKIPFTASNYSDLVSSASSKVEAGATAIATNEAIFTTAGSTSTSTSTSTSGTSSGTSSSMSSKTSPGSAATTSNAAMPIATAQEMVLGGAAIVVGLFVL
ncbi:uncharacterized protein N7498_006166 [Penicillium cinerascens]|uniref:Extracellular membrane protein CFEM domain-containing protein n=1 Tax=Penicillium cinerascens TaxID=70096 RepID=A0A9W9MHN3_9EURO|nr:uncharacterized protein N7498_006166 [Penicillium cinerascens]KAJ5201503.1 hypothetical protein N7498_006166 [Penicillium cinerascens]